MQKEESSAKFHPLSIVQVVGLNKKREAVLDGILIGFGVVLVFAVLAK